MNKSESLLDSLNSVALFFSDLEKPVSIGKREVSKLVHILSGLKDFRCPGKVVYRLGNLLAICLLLAMRGKLKSFYHVANYVRVREDEFVSLGLVERGKVPSHDTFRRVFGCLDANALRDAFIDRIGEFLERLTGRDPSARGKKQVMSGDGKTFNGSGRGDARNLNVLNIYNASKAVCLTSIPLTDKESEIPAFQMALARYNLHGYVVTADALHCQRKTCEVILKRRGSYVFTVKGNQQALLDEVSGRFSQTARFGRRAALKHNKCEYEFIILPKGYIGCDWPGQKTYVRMVSHKRKGQKDYNPIPQYFITSESDPQLIAEAIDNRWKIEGGLHLFKDEVLGEDECTFMDKNAVKVMATINNIVYSLYRIATAVLGYKSMGDTIIRFEDDPVALVSTILPLLEKKNLSALVRENMRGRKPKAQ